MAAYQGARPGLSVRVGLRPRSGVADEPGPPIGPAADQAPATRPGPATVAAAVAVGATPAALARRRVRATGTVRAGRRSNRVGIILGAIVVGFLLAFFSLAQTMRVSATGYELDRLIVQRDRLEATLDELHSDVSRLGQEPAIRKLALDAGLGQLGAPVVIEPR
jgi:hypothetical protein